MQDPLKYYNCNLHRADETDTFDDTSYMAMSDLGARQWFRIQISQLGDSDSTRKLTLHYASKGNSYISLKWDRKTSVQYDQLQIWVTDNYNPAAPGKIKNIRIETHPEKKFFNQG